MKYAIMKFITRLNNPFLIFATLLISLGWLYYQIFIVNHYNNKWSTLVCDTETSKEQLCTLSKLETRSYRRKEDCLENGNFLIKAGKLTDFKCGKGCVSKEGIFTCVEYCSDNSCSVTSYN